MPFQGTCGRCGAVRHDQGLGNEERHDCLGWATGQPCGGCWGCRLVAVFREVRRVLRDDGTLWMNCGSAYQEKQELMLPARLALALQADGWWLRSEIIWAKKNPMPESVTDRPTKAHEQVYLLTKSPHYHYDNEAVREPVIPDPRDQRWDTARTGKGRTDHLYDAERGLLQPKVDGWVRMSNPAGRNLRSVWPLASEPFSGAHFATFPSALVRRCLRASVSAGGCCSSCGTQFVRQVERDKGVPASHNGSTFTHGKTHEARAHLGAVGTGARTVAVTTTGFAPACACDAGVQPATVLDPFAGAGTTLITARGLFIRSVGIELSPSYCALAASRLTQGVLALAPVAGARSSHPHG